MSLGCFSILYEWKHTCLHFSVGLHGSVKFIHTVEYSSRSFICTAVWSPCFTYNTCHNQSLCICWHFKKSASTGKLVHWKEGLPLSCSLPLSWWEVSKEPWDEGLQDPAQRAQPLMGTGMETELDQHLFYPQEPTGHRRAQAGRVSTEWGPLG